MRTRSFASLASLLLLASDAAARQELVLGAQRLDENTPGFEVTFDPTENFGEAMTALGDLDGDGGADFAVTSRQGGDDVTGRFWILFGDGAGGISGSAEVTAGVGGFVGPLTNANRFGSALSFLGDLDGDGVVTLAVGAPNDDDGATGPTSLLDNRGAFWLLDLAPDGTVVDEKKFSDTTGGLPFDLATGDGFGSEIECLGDLDADGTLELAVSSRLADFGGTNRGGIWVLSLTPEKDIAGATLIADGSGGLSIGLQDLDQFGAGLARLDDLDGDGVPELAVGASGVGGPGVSTGDAWVLFLDRAAQVKSAVPIGPSAPGFPSTLGTLDQYGAELEVVGDLDGDGLPELAVGAPKHETEAGLTTGAVYLLSLDANASILSASRIAEGEGGFGEPLGDADDFGTGLLGQVDLDGDGKAELVVGSTQRFNTVSNQGEAWILELAGVTFPPRVTVTNGTGANPLCLSAANLPRLGQDWTPVTDASGTTLPGLSTLVLAPARTPPIATGFGELLLLVPPLGGSVILSQPVAFDAGGAATHVVPLPVQPALLGTTVLAQSIRTGAGPTLCNALQVTLGR